MSKSKTLQELNLIDSFLFSASTENPEDAELIARIIIERTIGKRVKDISVIPEKTLVGINTSYHGIRMDLYIMEYEDDEIKCVYDIEPNKYGIKELPMRSRFSQALTDSKLLRPGRKYEKIPEYISIWILTDDPFGDDRMVYTVKNTVEENPQIVYNDGVRRIFLYTGGKIGGTEVLRNLLNYFVKSDENNIADSDIRQLHTIVEKVKHSPEVGETYMTLQEMIDYEKDESYSQGVSDGISQGISQEISHGIGTLVRICRSHNISDEQIVKNIVEEYGITAAEADNYLKSN